MKTKSEILEKYIHQSKLLSSLSTETGKLTIFQAMDEYAYEVQKNYLFCGYCGKAKEFKVSTDINSGRTCKNKLCKNNNK